VLRSQTPELVMQEVYGILLAHFALRGLMHQAALRGGRDPDRVSFTHTLNVVRRTLPRFAALLPRGWRRLHQAVLDEILEVDIGKRRHRQAKRGVKRKQSRYPVRRRTEALQKVTPPTLEVLR
jgi:hypothetical protein